uniref:AlNc14C25G2488 protein n=1 Tax=Albugo laibachii Nc14 TaxID=890382 RepID=F0W6J8_9STRA|nr:AlNc14C25G2488 [Albugo laibachii Nc14]|eukprot:CCA16743.1 AlNc14C25G2488 [Albugo laibachii Nc14]
MAPMHSLQDVYVVHIFRALLFVVNDAVCHVDSVVSLPAAKARLETRYDTRIHWLQDRCGGRWQHLDLRFAENRLGAMCRSTVSEEQDVTAFFFQALNDLIHSLLKESASHPALLGTLVLHPMLLGRVPPKEAWFDRGLTKSNGSFSVPSSFADTPRSKIVADRRAEGIFWAQGRFHRGTAAAAPGVCKIASRTDSHPEFMQHERVVTGIHVALNERALLVDRQSNAHAKELLQTNSHRNCIVAKSGGNCCRLTLLSELDEEIIFETTEFICDTNAKEAVRRYFPAIMQRVNDSNDETDLLHDCVVCYGDMKIRKLALQPLD